MKRLIPLLIIAATTLFVSCGSNTPDETVADHVKKGLEFDKTISADTDNLTYTVTDETDEKATVKVKGTVDVSGTYKLEKKDNKWVIK